MNVAVNGDVRPVDGATVSDLLRELGLAEATVLVEHNGTPVPRDVWPRHAIADGDRVEILRIAAGG